MSNKWFSSFKHVMDYRLTAQLKDFNKLVIYGNFRLDAVDLGFLVIIITIVIVRHDIVEAEENCNEISFAHLLSCENMREYNLLRGLFGEAPEEEVEHIQEEILGLKFRDILTFFDASDTSFISEKIKENEQEGQGDCFSIVFSYNKTAFLNEEVVRRACNEPVVTYICKFKVHYKAYEQMILAASAEKEQKYDTLKKIKDETRGGRKAYNIYTYYTNEMDSDEENDAATQFLHSVLIFHFSNTFSFLILKLNIILSYELDAASACIYEFNTVTDSIIIKYRTENITLCLAISCFIFLIILVASALASAVEKESLRNSYVSETSNV
ncbi:unnamed protein product [Enterobius vermicularis]|uniref:CASPASE_P20 domain-containing protein n=1 Tax=Enterobius vermicularis TaxID=51028 RepID=A0A0N4UZ95_ENTVE|nr:unnamed protein product [Enterobius vermicularis]